MPRLVLPGAGHRRSFLGLAEELVAEGRAGDGSALGHDIAAHGDTWHTAAGFAAYVADVRAAERRPRRAGLVCETTWWWVEGEEILGRVALRHTLTDRLREVGGHVGYDVRPTVRRRGHATAMLAAVLPLAAERGLVEVLVTCDDTNVASRRVIERNGGVLEDQRGVKLRFWIPTG